MNGVVNYVACHIRLTVRPNIVVKYKSSYQCYETRSFTLDRKFSEYRLRDTKRSAQR